MSDKHDLSTVPSSWRGFRKGPPGAEICAGVSTETTESKSTAQDLRNLKKETAPFFEMMLLFYQTTRRHTPELRRLYNHCHGKPKSVLNLADRI